MTETKILDDTVESADNNAGRTIMFDMTASLVAEHHQMIMHATLSRCILISVLAMLAVFVIYGVESVVIAVLAGFVCFIIMNLIFGLSLKANEKKLLLKVDVTKNEYKFTDKHVDFSRYENGELVIFNHILYEEISHVKISDKFINFISAGVSYLIPRDKIPADSDIIALLERCETRKARVKKEAPHSPCKDHPSHKILKTLLSVSSALTLLVAIFVFFAPISYSDYFGISFILLVFPVSYFVIYIISKLKGVATKYYATVIVIISTLTLLVTSSLSIMSELENRKNEEIAISIFDDYASLTGNYIYADADMYYHYTDSAYLDGINKWVDITVAIKYMNSADKAEVNEIRAALTESTGWISSNDELIIGDYEKIIGKCDYYDKVKIFNAISGEYNKPLDGDAATYYIATYSASSHCINIYVFTIE